MVSRARKNPTTKLPPDAGMTAPADRARRGADLSFLPSGPGQPQRVQRVRGAVLAPAAGADHTGGVTLVTPVHVPTPRDVAAAADRLRPYVRRTPLLRLSLDGRPLVLKLEQLCVDSTDIGSNVHEETLAVALHRVAEYVRMHEVG